MKRLQALHNFTATVAGRKTRWTFGTMRGVLGECAGDAITVNPCQAESELLGTIVHEWLHRTFPDLSEDAVDEREAELQAILWHHLGYRRVLV